MKRIALALLTIVAGLAGCTVPGMYAGYRAPGNDNPSGALSNDVTARADIFSINTETVTRIRREVRAAHEILKAERASALKSAGAYQYKVGSGDVLRITIWNYPELNNPAATANELAGRIVNDDGRFFYPYAGYVQASGRTVTQIREDLTRGLQKALKDPQIDVGVAQYRSQRVAIVGEVKSPLTAPLTDVPARVTDAISAAGGYTVEADLSNATLQRGNQTIPLDLYALYQRGDFSQNVLLQHGDVLNVPDRRFNKVFVLGEVIAPRSLAMPRGPFSLTEALADQGGINPLTGNAGQIFVIRAQGASARPQIFHLNAAAPDALILADAFEMKPRDVVYVDVAGVARWNRVASNIIPAAAILLNSVDVFSPRAPR